MKKQKYNLNRILNPKSVAVVGASETSGKIGNVVLKNFIESKFQGKIFPVNPKYKEIFGIKCYSDLKKIPEKIDCVIIAVPAKIVPSIMEQGIERKVGGFIILSGGFEEVGKNELSEKVKSIAEKNNTPVVGPNCLGVYNPYIRMDSIFLPMHKLQRPKPGGIAFVTQSGAVGSTIIDLAAFYGLGVSKFISYGNGTVLNENDYLEYLSKDKDTEMIILYLEGAKDGRKLLDIMEKVNKTKPIIALKAGRSKTGQAAAHSHTGNIAGNYMAYHAAFRQSNVTEVDDIDELFDSVKIFGQVLPKGRKIGVITNGGGMGVLTTDAIENEKLEMAEFSKKTENTLKKIMPSYGNVANPLDLVADANVEMYERAIEAFMNDKNIDALVIIVLLQTPLIDERILNILVRASDDRRKPIITVSVGGEYTEAHRKMLESRGVPSYNSPKLAVKAMRRLIEYTERQKE